MSWWRSGITYLELIRFSHTVFALPFALGSAFLALRDTDRFGWTAELWGLLFWIVVAMVGARSGAMGFNRLVDRKWDADNPRTATRPSVTGLVRPFQLGIFILISFALLVYAAWRLNDLAFRLSPVAILIVCFYSFTKRFTAFSHLFLGLAIGIAPVGGWIAVNGTISGSAVVIGLSVLTWIAGFDILYALQDLEFDRTAGLKSIPVRIGIAKSLKLSRLLHAITLICWMILGRMERLHGLFYLGLVLCTALLIWEHRLLRPHDLSRLNLAFFNVNAIISLTIFLTLTLDIIVFA